MRYCHSLISIYSGVLLVLAAAAVPANPLDPTVVSGQASFASTGNTLTVTNTPGAIINWQGFSIDTNEITRFNQQSAASAVLNRVISNNPSSILGTLQSNGRVFLINPNGIMFGAGSIVDVAGLVASTLNLSDADFLAGRNKFTSPLTQAGEGSGVRVVNQGNISAQDGGQIYLIAPNVENTGVITAPNGEILLAAGSSVDLVSTTNPNLRVNITAPAGDATNVGQLIASSGSLGLFGTVVRNSGTVSADSATMQGGRIVFKASLRAEIGGTVSANSTATSSPDKGRLGGVGGAIHALGNQVGIMDGATVTANGTQGGGTILVGGDYQGKNPDVPNAQVTYVAPTATISADGGVPSPSGGGLGWGNGGKVIVWSDDTTRFYGNISARGGNNGGNGGFVETSGRNYLDFQGRVDTRAPQGSVGTLLLDPTTITIDNTADIILSGGFAGGVFSGAGNTCTLTWNTINTQLGLGNLEIQTYSLSSTNVGDININGSATLTASNTLTLLANRDINIATGVSVSAVGDVNLIAGWNNSGWAVTGGTGNITFNTGSSLSTLGNLYFNAGNSVTGAGATITANTLGIGNTNGSSLPGGVNLAGANMVNTLGVIIDSATGSLTFSNGKALTIGATTYATGIVASNNPNPINITTTAGNLTIAQPILSDSLGGAPITLTAANTLAINAAVTSTFNATPAGPVVLQAGSGGVVSNLSGIITTAALTATSGGGITLNAANAVGSFNATNSTSGNIVLTNTAATLNITGINNTSAAGSAAVSNTGAITVGGTVTASNSVSMTGVGITNNSIIKGNLGVSLNAGTGTLTNVGVGSITNGGGASTGAISLTSDKMVLTSLAAGPGTVTAGAGAVNIGNSTLTDAINLGSTTDAVTNTLELSSVELATISTTGLLSIGNASNSGAITVSAAMNLTSNTALANGAGGIAINGAIAATGKNLTLSTTGAAAQTAAIAAAGLELLGAGTYTFTNAANSIATLAGNAGSVSLTDSIALSVGTVNTVGLAATGAITLTSSGAISQTAAISTPGSLTTSSAGGTTLNGANAVGSFNATNSTSGNIVLTNTIATLAINGLSQSGVGVVTVNNTGSVNVSVGINNTATGLLSTQNAISINAMGNLIFDGTSGAGASANTGSIVLSGATGVELDNGDTGTAAYTALAGNVTISSTNGDVLALGGADVTGQNITLSSAPTRILDIYGYAGGNITATGTATIITGGSLNNVAPVHLGVVSANSLNVAAVGSVALNTTTANLTTSNTGVGGTTINNTGALTSVVMTDTLGYIALTNAGAATLNSLAAGGSVTVTATSASSNVNVAGGVTSTLATRLVANGNMTLNAGSTINAGTAPVTLSATGGNFANNSGSVAPITTTGLIRIYSTSPALDALNGMVSDYHLYNCTYAAGCLTAGTVDPGTGIGLYYSLAPTLTITANALSKVYGSVDPTLTYTTTGLVGVDTAATVLTGGLTRSVGENVGTYTITQGTLANQMGYGIAPFAGSSLNITQALLTVYADATSKILNTADPLLTYTVSGLQFTDTAAITLNGGSLSRVAGETVGAYQIDQGSLALSLTSPGTNYTMSYVSANFTILVPTVIDEIVNTSLLFGPDTGSAQSTSSSEEDKATEDVLEVADVEPTDDTTAQPLPVCPQ